MTAYSYRIVLVLGEDWSDVDFMKETIDAKMYVERICQVKKSLVQEDGSEMTSLALYAWCRRLLYHWRTTLNPLLATVIVAGMENDQRVRYDFKKRILSTNSFNRYLERVNDKGSGL